MSDSIDGVQVKDYITDHATYLKLRAIQKTIPVAYHNVTIKEQQYSDLVPKCLLPIVQHCDSRPSYLDDNNACKYRRAFNIVYGIAKGKKYSQIEPKVREGNEFDYYYIKALLTLFDIDEVKFRGALNE